VEEPLGRPQVVELLAVDHGRDLAGDHLLLAILFVGQAVEADEVLADLVLVASGDAQLALLLIGAAREADEHRDDAHVDDVAAVAPLAAQDHPRQRRDNVVPRVALADGDAPRELLHDRRRRERAQAEADRRGPRAAQAHGDADGQRHDQRREGPRELVAQVGGRRAAPGDAGADAREEQQDEPDGDHPLVEEGRPHRDALAQHRVRQRETSSRTG
jgi:hypothetical protein